MKLKCVQKADPRDPSFTVGSIYEVDSGLSDGDSYVVFGDDKLTWAITKDTLEFAGMPECGIFEIVEDSVATEEELCGKHCDKPMSPQRTMESMRRSAIEDLQTQCSRANMSISIDPEGFNIFDCDTDMQTMVESVADAIEILETKIEYKDSMGKWGWL